MINVRVQHAFDLCKLPKSKLTNVLYTSKHGIVKSQFSVCVWSTVAVYY